MSLIALAAPVCRVCDFCLIFVPFGHYDELEILSYTIPIICSIGADVRHNVTMPGMKRLIPSASSCFVDYLEFAPLFILAEHIAGDTRSKPTLGTDG